jgi:hypothetical protein
MILLACVLWLFGAPMLVATALIYSRRSRMTSKLAPVATELSADGDCPNCRNAYAGICSDCCEHTDLDHGICMDCDADILDRLIAAAEDRADYLADR